MDHANILLSDNTSDEEKRAVANNIIGIYDLFLNAEQILLASKKTLDWINSTALGSDNNREISRNNRIFLFDKILNNNKNMYIALILALCGKMDPTNLWFLIIFRTNNSNVEIPMDIGIGSGYRMDMALGIYYKLLDYYEFDVSNFINISDKKKQLIQDYRAEKYSCKFTKCAIKK